MGDNTTTFRPTSSTTCVFESTNQSRVECRSWKNPLDNTNILEIFHTYTPEDQRHQGHADEVTRRAFEFAKNKGMKVWPTCPYVEGTFLDRHRELKEMCVVPQEPAKLTANPLPSSDS